MTLLSALHDMSTCGILSLYAWPALTACLTSKGPINAVQACLVDTRTRSPGSMGVGQGLAAASARDARAGRERRHCEWEDGEASRATRAAWALPRWVAGVARVTGVCDSNASAVSTRVRDSLFRRLASCVTGVSGTGGATDAATHALFAATLGCAPGEGHLCSASSLTTACEVPEDGRKRAVCVLLRPSRPSKSSLCPPLSSS